MRVKPHYIHNIIENLGNVSSERLTPQFLSLAEDYIEGTTDTNQQYQIIRNLGDIVFDELPSDFMGHFEGLTVGMNGYHKSAIFSILSKVSEGKLTGNFVTRAKELLEGVTDERYQPTVIQNMACLEPKQLTPRFVEFVKALTLGASSGYVRGYIISALNGIQEDRLTDEFAQRMNTETIGMDEIDKSGHICLAISNELRW